MQRLIAGKYIERSPWAVAGVALALMVPWLFFGFPHPTHDGLIHARWTENFSRQFWSGELYPRWLQQSNGGLGSPAFFFYPPLPFWITSLFAPFASAAMGPFQSLAWSATLALVVSGLTARWCFIQWGLDPKNAFIGSLIYMVLPYHLCVDLTERGAFAEFWSFCWLPFIMGTLPALEAKATLPAGKAAVAFGLLFLTHLPTAVTFIPLVLYSAASQSRRVFERTLIGLFGGALLASIYIVPAVALQPAVELTAIEGHEMTRRLFFPGWNPLVPVQKWDEFNIGLFRVFLHLSISCALIAALQLSRKEARNQFLPWLGPAGIAAFMMLPVAGIVYEGLAPLQMIQFPWRFLAPFSFFLAGATALALQVETVGRWRKHCIITVAVISVAYGVGSLVDRYKRILDSPIAVVGEPLAVIQSTDEDVPEYVPKGVDFDALRRTFGPAREYIIAAGTPRVELKKNGPRRLELRIQSAEKSAVQLRRPYFPGLNITAGAGELSRASAGATLLQCPPGEHTISIELTRTGPEKVGIALSAFTLAGLIASAALRFYRNVKRQAPEQALAIEGGVC